MIDMATPPKIFVDLSNAITSIAERIFIFYPTSKSSRLFINILYLITLGASFMAMLSYDYVTPTIPIHNTATSQLTLTNLSSPINLSIPATNEGTTQNAQLITPPHMLVDNKYIRLIVGIIGLWLSVSFLYSNTMHSKLKNWDLTN
jgi:hypothetical protein